MMFAAGLLFQCLAVIGILYTLAAAILAGRWAPPAIRPLANPPSVTVLKPLHGAEPLLAANLRSFLEQDYAGSLQMVCGIQNPDDPAADSVHDDRIELCVDARRHGSNGKISNLINMTTLARHDLIVLSDSDMAVERDYLDRLAIAMAAPGVGAVTCLYAGRGDAGPWSRLAAAGISYQFLPSVMIGLALGLARPCMGSTIALSRETLDRIGGFSRFTNILADDHAIGSAIRELGLAVAVPPMIVTHGCAETSLLAVARHELRWNATVRGLDRWGYVGSIVTYPVPLALLAWISGGTIAPILLGLALLTRALLASRIDRVVGRKTAPLRVLPLRDTLSFILFGLSFCIRSIDWRGERLIIEQDGRVRADKESSL